MSDHIKIQHPRKPIVKASVTIAAVWPLFSGTPKPQTNADGTTEQPGEQVPKKKVSRFSGATTNEQVPIKHSP